MDVKELWRPAAARLSGMSGKTLGSDILAGMTLWGVLVPEGLAYAGMAGMPLEMGLYTLLASLPLYFLFGGSSVLVCSATSAEAIMTAAIVAPLAGLDPHRYASLTVLLVLVTGAIFVAAGACRLGRVASFLSKPIMTGFIFGLAIYIAVSQLHKVLGVHRGHGSTLMQLAHLLTNPDRINLVSTAVGGAALALIFLFERFAPRLPASLAVMALGIAGARLFELDSLQLMATVHSFPAGLPGVSLPEVTFADIESLIPPSIGLALVAFSQALGAAEGFAAKTGQRVDADRELRALGIANVGSSLMGGILAGGSMSSTAVNVAAGAKSQASTLTSWVMVILTLCFFTPVLRGFPEAILGAVVIHAVVRLMKVGEMKRYRALNRIDFILALVALGGVIFLNVLPALVIALAASVIRLVLYASNVSIAVLGRVGDDESLWMDTDQCPEAREAPGLRVLRLDRPLFFGNADRVHTRVLELCGSLPGGSTVVLDLKVNARLCVTGVDMLRSLAGELRDASIQMAVIEPAPEVLGILDKAGVLAAMGDGHVYQSAEHAARSLADRA